MAQAIDDILRELDAGYNPQRQAINDRISQLQPQADAQVAGLKQEQTNAFGDITNGARDKGMGFSGIPIAEQAKYTGSTFLPAVAKVQQSVNDARSSLFDNLNNINLDQRKTAYGIQNDQLTREQAAAQAAAALKASQAQSASYGNLFSGAGGATAPAAKSAAASYSQRASDKGYNFTDHNGKAISAAQYAQLTGTSLRSLLASMAQSGDNGAKLALNYVGDDFGVNAAKLGNNQQAINVVNSILGGINQYRPAAAKPAASGFKAPTTFGGLVNPLALRR